MIFYNNLLAKWFLGKKKHYFMVGGLFFTRYKYLEVWEDMELRIHARAILGMFLFDFSSGINFVFVAFVVVDDSSFRYL